MTTKISTEASDRTHVASGIGGRADILTVKNQRHMEAEGHTLRDETTEEKALRLLVMLLSLIPAGKKTQSGKHTDAVDIGREDVAAQGIEHHAGSCFQANAGKRA
jgi:hypothetical protein